MAVEVLSTAVSSSLRLALILLIPVVLCLVLATVFPQNELFGYLSTLAIGGFGIPAAVLIWGVIKRRGKSS